METKESDQNLAGASLEGHTHVEGRKKMRAMVAIDDSKESFYALKWVLDHLFTTSPPAAGADQSHPPESNQKLVTLVHVIEPIPHYAYPGGYVVETATKGLEVKANKVLCRASEVCKEYNVSSEMVVVTGEPKQMLCETAEKMGVDVLVVGCRGLGQIKRALLGSVSDYCAHQARCPVLIVKLPRESHRAN